MNMSGLHILHHEMLIKYEDSDEVTVDLLQKKVSCTIRSSSLFKFKFKNFKKKTPEIWYPKI
jgi:hypothetical protein